MPRLPDSSGTIEGTGYAPHLCPRSKARPGPSAETVAACRRRSQMLTLEQLTPVAMSGNGFWCPNVESGKTKLNTLGIRGGSQRSIENTTQLSCQRFRGKWLLQECRTGGENSVMNDRVIGIT